MLLGEKIISQSLIEISVMSGSLTLMNHFHLWMKYIMILLLKTGNVLLLIDELLCEELLKFLADEFAELLEVSIR